MSRQRSRDTGAELEIRRALFRAGLRYRLHRRPIPTLRRQADIVFVGPRVAVFVDGCFWHGCPSHASWPATNADWWLEKIEGNRSRDEDTNRRLSEAGWRVVRIWEHEPAFEAAARVREVVHARSGVDGRDRR